MRKLALSLVLTLAAAPAFAGGLSVDLPHLTWPDDGTLTVSTSNCTVAVDAVEPKTGACS